jgi:co-chaperonin GroES (HSP10)
VIAVGPGARDKSGKLIPIDLKVGDRIPLGKCSGTEIKIDGEDRLSIFGRNDDALKHSHGLHEALRTVNAAQR